MNVASRINNPVVIITDRHRGQVPPDFNNNANSSSCAISVQANSILNRFRCIIANGVEYT